MTESQLKQKSISDLCMVAKNYKFSIKEVIIKAILEHIKNQKSTKELEMQQPKRCDGCWYGKTTINSVICGKNGTYKEADDYCKYFKPKDKA